MQLPYLHVRNKGAAGEVERGERSEAAQLPQHRFSHDVGVLANVVRTDKLTGYKRATGWGCAYRSMWRSSFAKPCRSFRVWTV